jgi:pyridoxamine 5'-phosphate oxidase
VSGEPGAGVEPLERLQRWYDEAVAAGLPEPNAIAVATATEDGAPSVRFVLLKGIDARGIQFFTNYDSRKGRELAENPRAAAALYWQPLQRQVRLAGPVELLSAEESDAYYASRPRGSRLGAWASPQGRPIPDRGWLEARVAEADAAFPDEAIPRPPHWGGYRLVPDSVEFWQGRESRLHDREHFTRTPDGGWRAERLSP